MSTAGAAPQRDPAAASGAQGPQISQDRRKAADTSDVVSNAETTPGATPESSAPADPPVDADAVLTMVREAIERQLSDHLRDVNRRVAEAQRALSDAQADLRIDLVTRLDERSTELRRSQEAHAATAAQRVAELQRAQDEHATSMSARLAEVQRSQEQQAAAVSARVAEVQQAQEQQSGVAARVGELQRAHDELAAEVAARVAESRRAHQDHAAVTTELRARLDHDVAAIDARFREAVAADEARTKAVGERVDAQLQEMAQRIEGQLTALLDSVRLRTAATESEIAELRRTVTDLETRLVAADERIDGVAEAASQFDQDAIDALKQEMSRAVGEATLVRIEIDRIAASSAERFDKVTVRMGEIEALLADEMDVSAAVQLERLEELERALAELDPDQFVRKDGAAGHPGDRITHPTHPDASFDAG